MKTTKIVALIGRLSVISIALLALSACRDDDEKWEIGREAQAGIEAHHAQTDAEWSLYRDDVVRSQDLMKASLRMAAGGATVFDRKEIEDLRTRVEALRQRFVALVALVDVPRKDIINTRISLRADFQSTRTAVDALLVRLGQDPHDIARWQDAR